MHPFPLRHRAEARLGDHAWNGVRHKVVPWVLCATTGAFLIGGCDTPQPEPECTVQDDCASGFNCIDGECLVDRPADLVFDAGQTRSDAGRTDAGQTDAGRPNPAQPDTGPLGGGRTDAGPPDAGRPDTGPPDAGPAPDAGVCGPASCAARSAECGIVIDDCGASVDCLGCETGFECGTGEFANRCRCSPRSCAELGAQCGTIIDNCGVMQQCGSCGVSGQTCRNNRCECPGGQALCNGSCTARCGQTFTSAGNHAYRVPGECRTVRIKARGAGGGHGGRNGRGAGGGLAQGDFSVSGGENLAVVVGSPGSRGSETGSLAGGAGGTPGGGRGGTGGGFGSSGGGGGGGGYSGVFRGGISQANALVIGGGGAGSGAGFGRLAGAGGGTVGQDGDAGGGTQSSGGAGGTVANPRASLSGGPLRGGPGQNQNVGDGGGGGGGGYFGGGGGAGANTDAFGGGGGSGYVAPSGSNRSLTSGNRGNPAEANDPDRGDAGNPQAPGLISIDCIAFR